MLSLSLIHICLQKLIGDFISTHFRLQIIGGYFGGFYENPVFALILLFYASIEEEGHVGVFLCFCNAQLRKTLFRDISVSYTHLHDEPLSGGGQLSAVAVRVGSDALSGLDEA